MGYPNPEDALYSIDDAEVLGAEPWHEWYLDHPEGVAVSDSGQVYAGGEDGQLYRIDPESNEVTLLAETSGFSLGLAFSLDGDLYVCDMRHAVHRLPMDGDEPTGDMEMVVTGSPDEPPWQPNFPVFDRDGRLYVSDSGERTAPMDDSGGCIYVLDPDGSERILTDEPSAWTNGMALTQDEETLYVAETGTESISAITLDDGEAVDIEPISDECGLVDGLALDSNDDLYVASIGDNMIYRLRDGEREVLLSDSDGLIMGNPTNVAFGGPDMQTLYIANLGLTHLTAIKIEATGRYPTARL